MNNRRKDQQENKETSTCYRIIKGKLRSRLIQKECKTKINKLCLELKHILHSRSIEAYKEKRKENPLPTYLLTYLLHIAEFFLRS